MVRPSQGVRMTALSGGTLRMRRSVYFDDAEKGELMDLPVSSFLIEHPQGNLLFDTGCHPQLAVDPEPRIGGMAKMMSIVADPSENVVEGLRGLGFAPADIDVLVISHLHPDHCGCNVFFPGATALCQRCERAAAEAEGAPSRGYFRVDWIEGPDLSEIEGEHDVFGDGRVVLLPLPGHTPGSMGALVTLESGARVLLASDAASVESNISAGTVPRNTWDAALFQKSMAEIRRLRGQGAKVMLGHDPDQWRGVRAAPVFV